MRGLAGLVALAVTLGAASAASAHHVGTVVPKDTEVSANFKQLKSSIQAGKFDAALKLFTEGALRAEMVKLERRLPAGQEEQLRAALKAKDARGAEARLLVFMLFMARDLAREAERRIADGKVPEAVRAAQVWKLLEAVWRYYNLVDFAVYERDVKAALGMRLAFDDAESAVCAERAAPPKARGSPAPAGGELCQAVRTASKTAASPPGGASRLARSKEALGRMTEIMTGVIERSVSSTPAVPAGAGAIRP